MQEPSSSIAASGDWRSQISSGTRQRIVNKILNTLKKSVPIANPEGSNELGNIAIRFEERIYTAATDKTDYLQKITMKMLSMEGKTQQPAPINQSIPNAGAVNQNLADPGSLGVQSQIKNPGQPLIISNRSVLPQNLQNNSSASLQNSSGLSPALPSISGLSQPNKSDFTQASNLQNMAGISQSSINNAIGQVTQTEIYAQEQKHMQGRQKQQQQSHNPLISHHRIQHELLNQKVHSSLLQQQEQQPQGQPKQSLLSPNQLESSHPFLQISPNFQSNQSNVQQAQAASAQSPQPGCQQDQLNQIQHSVARQRPSHPSHQQEPYLQQQSVSISRQSTLSQQQQIMGQQGNMSNNTADIQQKQQRLPVQQNSLSSMQQPKQMTYQQGLASEQQQKHQLGSQTNMSSLQQPQLVVGQVPSNSNTQPQQRAMLMQKLAQQKQHQQQLPTPHSSFTFLHSQGQQSQHQSSQQQLMSWFQPQTTQLQQQSSSMRWKTQQKLQGSGPLLHVQYTTEQKPHFQTHKELAEVSSSTSVDSTTQRGNASVIDWQEECYQKVKSMREQYYTELLELYQGIALQLQQHEALIPPGKQSEQHERLKLWKIKLEQRLKFMQTPKHDITVDHKEKLPLFERQIINLITSSKKNSPQVQGQWQFQQPNVGNAHSIPEQQQSQSSLILLSNIHTNQAPQVMQGSGTSLQVPGASNVQHASMPSSKEHQHISNALQIISKTDSVQGNSFNSKQPGAIGSELRQHPQRYQQQKQQPQLPVHQLWHLHSMNELNELKGKEGSGVKSWLNEYSAGQRHNYHFNQLKTRAPYPVSSPQILQALSSDISHHSSPQIDQNGLLSSSPKTKGPPQSGNSPLSVTPSTPFAPLATLVDSEKQQPAISSAGHQQTPAAPLQPHPVVISTPGISASSLLADCTSQDGNQANVPATSETSTTEQPVDRLIKVAQSVTPETLSSSVNDIGSIVSMIDRIAGSAPANGSRAAAGEDLVAMTMCHLQARNVMSKDGGATGKKMKHRTVAMPLNDISSPGSDDDSFKQLQDFESSELESSATSRIKRLRSEVNHRLLEEIWKINQKLIDTVVDMSKNNEDEEGIVVKFSYTAIALSPSLKAQFACTQTSPIMPLRLLVPANYPECSPVLLDKLPNYPSNGFEDLSTRAKSKFSISLRNLTQPMSLEEMAKTWDICSREVILEYAQQTGGGSFSSTYGSWENRIAA